MPLTAVAEVGNLRCQAGRYHQVSGRSLPPMAVGAARRAAALLHGCLPPIDAGGTSLPGSPQEGWLQACRAKSPEGG
jgi:hypothetical protein